MVSEAQRKAQRKYDKENTKMVSVKYNKKDMDEYKALQKYLADNPKQSANKLIKSLIYEFLKEQEQNTSNDNSTSGINIYEGIDKAALDDIRDIYGRDVADKVLEEYKEFLQDVIIEINKKEINHWIKSRPRIFKHNNSKLNTMGLQVYFMREFNSFLFKLKGKLHI